MTGQPNPHGPLPFDIVGDGDVPVLMLHGLGADRRQPQALLTDSLTRQGRYLVPDLRGHGQSTLPCAADDLSFSRMAQDVEETLQTAGLVGPLVLIGISMGAAIACELLARGGVHPRGIVLIRPAWGWQPHPPNLAVFPLMAQLLETMPTYKARDRLRNSREFAGIQTVSTAAATALLAQFDAPRAKERVGRLAALPADAPSRPNGPLARPALVIGSGRDPVHPISVARSISADLDIPFGEVPPRYEAPESHAQHVSAAIQRVVSKT